MRIPFLALASATLLAMPALAFADDAVVVHGAAPPPGQTVVVQPGSTVETQKVEPCHSRTTTTTNNDTGASHTQQTTNCPE